MIIKKRLPVTGVIYLDDNPPIMDNTWLNLPIYGQGDRSFRYR
jgi:hypothetical protein